MRVDVARARRRVGVIVSANGGSRGGECGKSRHPGFSSALGLDVSGRVRHNVGARDLPAAELFLPDRAQFLFDFGDSLNHASQFFVVRERRPRSQLGAKRVESREVRVGEVVQSSMERKLGRVASRDDDFLFFSFHTPPTPTFTHTQHR